MDYNVLAETVEKNGHKVKYRVTRSNGKTETKRLFYGARGVCEFAQNSRKHGFFIGNEYRDWLSCEPIIQTKNDCYKRFVKRVNFIHNILVKSGMWKEYDERLFCYILNLSETARYDMFSLLYDTEHYVIADSKNYHAKMDRLQNDFLSILEILTCCKTCGKTSVSRLSTMKRACMTSIPIRLKMQ